MPELTEKELIKKFVKSRESGDGGVVGGKIEYGHQIDLEPYRPFERVGRRKVRNPKSEAQASAIQAQPENQDSSCRDKSLRAQWLDAILGKNPSGVPSPVY